MDSIVVADLAAPFADWGESITYTPVGGAPVSCTGIITPGEDLDDAQWKTALQASSELRVLKADVPIWTYRDAVEVDGVTWEVVKELAETPGYWVLEIRHDVRPTFGGANA
jgi:hypothetical protein